MSAPPPLLSCQGLEAGYGASQVLFGIHLQIAAGEVVSLLGRNGMGKSTTIKALVGALRPTAGSIHFAGQSTARLPCDAIARLGLAIVPEGRHVFPNLTVREHLVAFADRRNGLSDVWDLERIYGVFPRLKERQHHLGSQLSGGEQQMLAIGRALSTNPRLLILDEATEGLAPVIREEIWRCLAALKAAGQTILVVDKYVHRLMDLADRHLILERGRLVWEGDSAALNADRRLWERYLAV
ncbi:MAG: ABC transporter ATP-binding protein [Acidovorax temperans]|uniref:ABC transporter ATP-binding protein n=1 Tax=Acidovorax temperans TaxID=80878 RepID=UPI00391A951E